jgi:hypothetical protein
MRPLTKSFPSYQPKYLWVFIFRVAEKTFSLDLVFLKKGSMRPLTKSFPSYHPEYL